ncbi:MAG: hypothetical protein GX421_04460 [Caldisericales bacterium]|nr:hypothetical protein [Caldisericales bacterium]
MKNIKNFALLLGLLATLASCAQASRELDVDKLVNPLKAGDKPDIEIVDPVIAEAPFKLDKAKLDKLSPYVSVYKDARFDPTRSFIVGEDNEYAGKTKITAETYHNATAEEVYTWIVDHLADTGLRVAKKEEIGNQDPLIFIEADGTAHITAIGKQSFMKIDVWTLTAYPGWVRVNYEGTSDKPFGK